MISFAREEGGVFTNGTLSTLSGSPQASWTFKQDGGEFTVEREVDQDDFDEIWGQFNEPVFVRHAVTNPDAKLDFRRNYLIHIMYNIRGDAGRITFLVPETERDSVWLRWLEMIEATQRLD